MLSKVAVPLGTKDFLPYLTQIDPGTEVLYGVFIGADEIAYFTQAHTVGLHKRMKMYSEPVKQSPARRFARAEDRLSG